MIQIVNANGETVAAYEYDPYGKVISATGTMAEVNPIRYRGYYYDTETGFYYLQSRYYDPTTCRFINADSYASTGQGIIGFNMFAYCGNNPTNYLDSAGSNPVYFANYFSYTLCGVLGELLIVFASIKTSIEAALASIPVPIICIAALAVTVAGIVCLLNTMQELRIQAEETVAWVKAKILAKEISKEQLSGYTVYAISKRGTSDVVYVGITKNYNSQNYYHQRRPGAKYPISDFEMTPLMTGLSYKDARALEHTLITAFTINCLDNLINSIAEKNLYKFYDEFERINSLMSCYFDTN